MSINHTIVDHPSKIMVQFNGSGALNDFGYTFQMDSSAIHAALANYEVKLPAASSQLYADLDADCKSLVSELFPRLRAMPAEQVIRHLNLSTSAGRNHPSQTKRQALHLPENHVFKDTGLGERFASGSPEAIAIQMVKGFTSKYSDHHSLFPCSLGIKPKCYQYQSIQLPENQISNQPLCSILQRENMPDTVIEKTKGRIIWSVPIEVVLFEGQYACPYYQWIKQNQRCPIMLGRDNKARVFQYVNQCQDKTRVTLDWSQFDSRVPGWLIAIVLKHLISNIDFLFGENVDDVIKMNCSYFIHTRVVSKTYHVDFVKHQGIPSGSMWTQIVGSICNMLVVRHCLNKRGVFFGDHLVLGDDTIFSLTTQDSRTAMSILHQLSKDAADLFGFSLNVDKCDISQPGDPVSFIGFKVDSTGREIPNFAKLQFKLRFLSKPLSIDQEKLRFLALYYLGGYMIPEYRVLAKVLDFSTINVDDIDEETEKKLKYVLGIDVDQLIQPGFDITQVNVDLLAFGWTPAGRRPVQLPQHVMFNPTS